MKRVFATVVAVGASLFLLGSAEAEVVYSTLGPGDSYNGMVGLTVGFPISGANYYAEAGAFTPASTVSFDEVDLAVTWPGAGRGSAILVQLRTDNSGLPGSVLEAFTFSNLPVSGTVSSGDLLEGESVLHPELFAGAQYWVAVVPNGDDIFDSWNDSLPAVLGPQSSSTNGGLTWPTPTDHTQGAFRVDGSPVPEPSTLALLAAGALGLLGYGWRRRAARRTAKPAAFDHQDDGAAILSMPSHRAEAARRAA